MKKEEIINGLKMSMELTLFDPSTGEVMEPRQLNDINRTAYEAYKGAIELLEKQPDTTIHDSIPAKTGKNDGDKTSGDCISRQQAIDALLGITAMRNTIPLDSAIFNIKKLPSVQPDLGKYEYHYDHTDCIWYRPEARNRCPVTCAQYRDGWNDAMNYIFRGGKGYRPYRRGEQYEE